MNTLRFCLLPCKWQHDVDVNYTEQRRPSGFRTWTMNSYSFTWSKTKECDHKLRLLPYFVLIGFFFFFFGLLFIPMQWLSKHFFIFFPKQTGANWICWLGVCYVGEHELDDALVGGAERSPWCSSPCRCTLRGPVSLLNDAGHHRTVLFNLKSAGFKALCWQ